MSNNRRKTNHKQQETKTPTVSYLAFESAMARADRVNKRLWWAILGLIGLVAASNGCWMAHFMGLL